MIRLALNLEDTDTGSVYSATALVTERQLALPIDHLGLLFGNPMLSAVRARWQQQAAQEHQASMAEQAQDAAAQQDDEA